MPLGGPLKRVMDEHEAKKIAAKGKELKKRASVTGKDHEETRAKRTCGDLQG